MALASADDTELQPLTESRFDELARLAERIWRSHYPSILSHAQIDYMLRGRFASASLIRYLDSDVCWLELLQRADALLGYCSYARVAGGATMRLEQLYVLPEYHGRGLGGRMLDHVEGRARALGCQVLELTVNKANQSAIGVYGKRGFRVCASICVDIGGGFVMDDHVMKKALENA